MQIFRLGLIASLLLSPMSFSHHSFFGRFDTGSYIELEGVVTDVLWRNPHVQINLESTNEAGRKVLWNLESGSPTLMQRAGVSRDSIQVGERIKVAAYPPLTDKQEAFATNVLLPSGEELMLQTGASAKFGQETTGDFSFRFRTEGDRNRPELGLFRIWTFTGAEPFLFPESINRDFDLTTYPLTAASKAALAEFNAFTDNPTNNCTPKGMPTIMEQPLPMEILDEGDTIVLRLEEYDLFRTIHLDKTEAPVNLPSSALGYSTGYWEEETLTVTTTHLNWPHFNQAGIPQSQQSILTERFTVVEEGSEMDYELTVTDPVNFTKPVLLTKKWLYVPGVEVIPFECTSNSDLLF